MIRQSVSFKNIASILTSIHKSNKPTLLSLIGKPGIDSRFLHICDDVFISDIDLGDYYYNGQNIDNDKLDDFLEYHKNQSALDYFK
jgi:hypothetical protein